MAKPIFTGQTPEAAARYLASKGPAAIKRMQAIVNRAGDVPPGDLSPGAPDLETVRYA